MPYHQSGIDAKCLHSRLPSMSFDFQKARHKPHIRHSDFCRKACCETGDKPIILFASVLEHILTFGHLTHPAGLIRDLRRMTCAVWPFIVVLSLTVLCPSRAQASCGDYLGPHQTMTQQAPDEHLPMNGAPREQRCHGPSCRQGQTSPPNPVPVTPSHVQDHWAWIAGDLAFANQHVARHDHSIEPTMLSTFADRLDRPPRF